MQIGDTYEYKNVVTKEITAGALGSGGLDISATFPPPPSARRSPPRPS